MLLGADFYQDEDRARDVASGSAGVVLDRVIVDKNACIADGVRLSTTSGVHADGDGWYIRDGIIVVPKGAVVRAGSDSDAGPADGPELSERGEFAH